MNENAFENQNANAENTDNLAQNDEQENSVQDLGQEVVSEDFEVDAENDLENATLGKLELELQETKDKYLRLVAEFDNFRRRNAKENQELRKTAGKEIIESLLVVLDDTDRASKQLEKSTDIESVREGISLVFNKLRNILQQKGLKAMDAVNQTFDADLHEAITEIPAPNKNMVGKVIDVVEPGYYLNDKLIRHAKVVVGK
ncbi:MAG: nucleotide exchange factor GrpE [Flavipsychrobacter sp.]|nr:nucleotide exchange factor GrpE [Flavipsychrobacter sp.]